MTQKPYYITTAIAYTSAKPHIGNVYEIVLADAVARYMRLYGYDVYFQTGTDEHGQKIEDKALAQGITPQQFVDNVAGEIQRNWDVMNTSYDKFVRTTDPMHKEKVKAMFKKLYDQGDIYKDQYEGMYCKPCESFFTENQLVDGKCPDCGADVTFEKEEAYFFKMSKYQDRLEQYILDNPDFIQPESRKNEMLNNFIRPGLKDLCVSRTSFKWGVPVDFDPNHVVYVWIDALSNYITFLDYDVNGKHGELFNKYWPADIHLIGKDILRFHTIYWPIMLMALNVELPKKVFGHPWLLIGDGKMSKSKGNVIYADELVKNFGVDAVRYYILKEMPFAQDGTLSYELLIERINGELVNILGNLVNRTIAMNEKYFDGVVPADLAHEVIDDELIQLCNDTLNASVDKMHDMRVSDTIQLVMNLARRSNKYIDETTPWVLAKDEEKKNRLSSVIYTLLETIRYIGILISPFLPDTSDKILEMLNTEKKDWNSLVKFGQLEVGSKLNKAIILFERIDVEKKLKEIEVLLSVNTKNENTVEQKAELIDEVEQISIDDFAKVQLLTGKILSAEKHPDADKLYILKVDTADRVRTIVSGIAKHFTIDELIGKNVVVVANLKPAKLRGVLSEGMLLLAQEGKKLTFITPELNVGAGSIIK